MPEYIITHCTVNDGAEVARNNMSAYWQDVNWVWMWINHTLEDLIEINTDRYPRILLRDRDTVRHLKAVDPDTGKLVGYARWKLPESHCRHADGSIVWPEGQVPDVSDEERTRIMDAAAEAQSRWHPIDISREEDPDTIVDARSEELFAVKPYVKLDYIAVHPGHQNKGVGLALVEHGLAKLRELGLDCFVHALEGGFRLYEKAGFGILDSIVQDATQVGGSSHYEVRFMVRKADEQ